MISEFKKERCTANVHVSSKYHCWIRHWWNSNSVNAKCFMIKIGFWRATPNAAEELPWPTESYDVRWDDRERLLVARYLDCGQEHAAYKGWSTCRICGKGNGSRDLTDGMYLWPEGFSHYVRDHKVKPPQDFIDRVKQNSVPELFGNKPDEVDVELPKDEGIDKLAQKVIAAGEFYKEDYKLEKIDILGLDSLDDKPVIAPLAKFLAKHEATIMRYIECSCNKAIICSPSGKTRYVHHGNLRIRYFGTENDGKRIIEQMKVEDAELGR